MNAVPVDAARARLLALSCNFRTAELPVLERLALPRERLAALYACLLYTSPSPRD